MIKKRQPELQETRVYECSDTNCQFRFPVQTAEEAVILGKCPRCGARAQFIEDYQSIHHETYPVKVTPFRVSVLADNIRSAHNIGSIFRTSDGAGIEHLHLCGISSTPLQRAVRKTSLGSENSVLWTYHPNGVRAAQYHLQQGYQLWALETTPDSENIFSISYPQPAQPILLIVGNEISGIDPGIIRIANKLIHIPMQGVKGSLNVSNAFSIAIYAICFRLRKM